MHVVIIHKKKKKKNETNLYHLFPVGNDKNNNDNDAY